MKPLIKQVVSKNLTKGTRDPQLQDLAKSKIELGKQINDLKNGISDIITTAKDWEVMHKGESFDDGKRMDDQIYNLSNNARSESRDEERRSRDKESKRSGDEEKRRQSRDKERGRSRDKSRVKERRSRDEEGTGSQDEVRKRRS